MDCPPAPFTPRFCFSNCAGSECVDVMSYQKCDNSTTPNVNSTSTNMTANTDLDDDSNCVETCPE